MKQKDILFLLISSTFLAIVWIIFTILHNALTSTISGTLNQQIQPIAGSFDNQTIQTLLKRQQITPQFSLKGTDQLTLTPTPTLAPVAVVSPTGINITPTIVVATPSVTPTNSPSPTSTVTPTP
jgi:hypothetical protein